MPITPNASTAVNVFFVIQTMVETPCNSTSMKSSEHIAPKPTPYPERSVIHIGSGVIQTAVANAIRLAIDDPQQGSWSMLFDAGGERRAQRQEGTDDTGRGGSQISDARTHDFGLPLLRWSCEIFGPRATFRLLFLAINPELITANSPAMRNDVVRKTPNFPSRVPPAAIARPAEFRSRSHGGSSRAEGVAAASRMGCEIESF